MRQLAILTAIVMTVACHEDLGVGDAPAELVEVASFTFSGVEAVDEARLRDVLATKPTPWLPWSQTRSFDRAAFEQDLARIEAFYTTHGYPNAEIASYDIDLNDEGTEVDLHVVVDEGAPLLITGIELNGFDVLTDTEREQLRSALPITTGEPLVERELVASGELAVNLLKSNGYPWASVDVARESIADGVAVRLRADPGQLAVFGPIEVIGNASVDDEIIRRQLLYKPGEPYQLDAVRESLRQLYALELFRFANIEFAGDERAGGEFPTRVVVTEADHRRLDFSVGYGTEEKGRVEAQWRQPQLLWRCPDADAARQVVMARSRR